MTRFPIAETCCWQCQENVLKYSADDDFKDIATEGLRLNIWIRHVNPSTENYQ